MALARHVTAVVGLLRLVLPGLAQQECSFPAHRVSCTECQGAECIWPMPSSGDEAEADTVAGDSAATTATLPTDFAFNNCTMRSGKELCPPELLDSMARYTKIVLLAGPPMMSTGGTGALTASFTTSIHIATAPTHLLVGTDESYSLEVEATAVSINATTQFGAMRALESFSQLVRWTTQHDGSQSYTVAFPLLIEDRPRYTWRGLLIDSSRSYLPVPTILRTLDAMSFAKLNTLHWHVLDDTAWPLVSETYPKFATEGAYAPDAVYSATDVARIMLHAKNRGIRVVPEIEGPGHAAIWGTAYPNTTIDCREGNGPGLQTLLNPTGIVYDMLDKLLAEWNAFDDSFVHLGGDEVETLRCWNESAEVRKFMAAHSIPHVDGMRDYYQMRMQEVAARHGKRAIFWEDVFDAGYQLRNDSIVNIWLSTDHLGPAVKAGHQVVFSWGWYLDEQHPDSQRYLVTPTNPKGDLNFWEDVWKDFYLNDPVKALAAQGIMLTPDEEARIIGGA